MHYANLLRLRRKKTKVGWTVSVQAGVRFVNFSLIQQNSKSLPILQSVNKKDITSPKSNSIIPVKKLPGTTGIARLKLYLCHLTSDIYLQTSDTRRLTSYLCHQMSVIRHLLLDISHQTSVLRHLSSDIIPLSWDVLHQMSVIRHLSSDFWHQTYVIRQLSLDV